MSNSGTTPIQYIDVKVDKDDVEEGVTQILQVLRPEWNSQDVTSEEFTEGYANKMICYYLKEDAKKDDGIIMRIHLLDIEGLNLGFARTGEICGMQIAHAIGAFPKIYATFKNGVVYKYFQGRTLNFYDLNNPVIIQDIAKKLYRYNHANFESMSLVGMKGEPAKVDTTPKMDMAQIKQVIATLPETTENLKKKPVFDKYRKQLSNEYFLKEFEFLEDIQKDMAFEMNLTHGDLHPKNIVLNEETNEVCFVDFEGTHFSLTESDLARLFSLKQVLEIIGMISSDEPDISPESRQLFERSYLEGKYDDPSKVTEEEIELLDIRIKWLEIANNFKGLPFMFMDIELKEDKKVDMLAIADAMLDRYNGERQELPLLRNRYLELKNKL